MYKIGLSSCGKPLCEELFKQYRDAGITAMEISVDALEYAGLDYDSLKTWADKYGIELWSLHLPFSSSRGINISKEETWEATVALHKAVIEKASKIGIKRFILHPSGEPISDEDRPQRMKRAKESISLILDTARKHDAIIALEDLPRSCLGRNSDEILELISDHEDLMVCFDTNHLTMEDPVEFIRKVGKRIITVHISDYDFIDERHWLPGEGQLDWQSILTAFREVGYQGPWLYEVLFATPATVQRSRDLTCKDFANNARELFEKKNITIL